MQRSSLLLGTIVAITCMPGLAAAPTVEIEWVPVTWQQVAVSDGEKLYGELCASCHGAQARGDGPAAAALDTAIPDLTRLAIRNGGQFPLADVERTIAGDRIHGTREMPQWRLVLRDVRPDIKLGHRETFARARIHDVALHLESLQLR